MSRLRLTPDHLETIHDHARAAYPEECCGVLMGTLGEGGLGGTVEVARPLENERQDSRHNRYVIHPETVLGAHKEARRLGLDILGYFHSHPDHPAVPSEFDREHAWPGVSYVITSVEQGQIAGTRSWQLTEDRDAFDEETLEVIPEGAVSPVTVASSRQEVVP